MGIGRSTRGGDAATWRKPGNLDLEWGVMTEFKAFLADEGGASAAEYALILAIVGGGIALAAIALGGAIATSMNNIADCIDTTTC